MIEGSRTRLLIVAVVVVSMFTALVARLWYLQAMSPGQFSVAARTNSVRLVHVDAPRGRILDRKGRVIVDNRVANTVTVSRSLTGALLDRVLERLAEVLAVPVASLRNRLNDQHFSPYKPVPVATDVSKDVVATLREHQDAFPGVEAVQLPVREYPLGALGAHLVGYAGEINDSELNAHKHEGYRLGDRIGKTGIESAFEADLRGSPGTDKLEVDSRGRVLHELGSEAPVDGNDVQLTLDLDVQRAAEAALQQGITAARASFDKERKKNFLAPAGAVVVLDARDGSVVASASYPTFNPGDFQNGIRTDVFKALNDPKSAFPLENRVIQAQYAPGSTFKLATALAALDTGIITPSTTYDDVGSVQVGNRVFRNALGRSFGRVNLARALSVSSDSFFYSLGYRIWKQPGASAERIQQVARQLGFGTRTGVALPAELPGRVPDGDWKRRIHDAKPQLFPDARWFPGDNVNLAVGQGDVLVTPMQLAAAYATLVNGGTLYTPRLASAVLDAAGHVLKNVPVATKGTVPVVAARRAALIDGLRAAVADKAGTAYEAFAGFPLDRFPVIGKTGTAQVRDRQDTSLFVGSVTGADGVPYVAVAVVEEAGFGASIAAPIVRQVMQTLIGVQPTPIAPVAGSD